jgi:methylmalonyl-CoA/ethylmalonyl-CoA epimerase
MNAQLPYPIDHIGIATTDLEAASVPYRAIGLEPLGADEDVVSQAVRVRAFKSGDSLIELLMPLTASSPIQMFLERRGAGLHHLALRVEKIETEVSRLQGLGAVFISPVPRVGRAGTRVVFLHPKWCGGVLIELVEHAQHFSGSSL